jgi:hypothetical protein
VNAARSSEPRPDEDPASVADHAPDSDEPTTDGAAPPQVPRVEDVETEGTALPSDQAAEKSPVAEADMRLPSGRVFVIDNKEYPDPGPELPITGARSVQAMYRDYFPGQLDNVDVAQKTRADGTVEVTFRGKICPGDHSFVRDPLKLPAEFFLSKFRLTGDTRGGKSRKYPDDISRLWGELAGQDTFPCEDLVPMLTVQQACDLAL